MYVFVINWIRTTVFGPLTAQAPILGAYYSFFSEKYSHWKNTVFQFNTIIKHILNTAYTGIKRKISCSGSSSQSPASKEVPAFLSKG